MKRLLICFAGLLAAAACLMIGNMTRVEDELPDFQSWSPPEETLDAETVELRWKLLRWYNINSISDKPESGYDSAYSHVVPHGNGLVCWLELENGYVLPVFQAGAATSDAACFIHDSSTPFPIQYGGSTVIAWNGEVADKEAWLASLALTEEQRLIVHILDGEYRYSIAGVYDAMPDAPGEGECILAIPGRDGELTWVYCVPEPAASISCV